jgi:hypothetical protein
VNGLDKVAIGHLCKFFGGHDWNGSARNKQSLKKIKNKTKI